MNRIIMPKTNTANLYTIELLLYGEVVNSADNITDDISSAKRPK